MPIAKLADLVISNGTDASPILPKAILEKISALTIFGPSTLPETIAVEVSDEKSPGASDWTTLQSSGADVTISAGSATVIEIVKGMPFNSLRLRSTGGNVAADRIFPLNAREVY